MVSSFFFAVVFLPLLSAAATLRRAGYGSDGCTKTIASLADVAAAVKCTTININAFTVPAGKEFSLTLLKGTTVNLNGDITFGNSSWAGPLFMIKGDSITFNGNGYSLDGGGPFYWDGQGSNSGVTKPRPMIKVEISGTFANTKVVNSPAQTFSVQNPGPLVITNVTIDNSQGDLPNSKSSGSPAGHNTDGFDLSTSNLTIENCSIRNQDDCAAINRGANIVFRDNTCNGGHGISIGSISSGVTVSGIVISGNTIINSDQALRVKTDASASGSTVNNITYSGNVGTGLRRFGVLIDQSYPAVLSTPGTGVQISDINFTGAINTLSVASAAIPIAVNCGYGACSGTWNWTSLETSGGKSNFFDNLPTINGVDTSKL